MQAAQPQLDLKDIHLPDAVSWWPPAVGYWIILAVFIFIIMTFFAIKAYRKKREVKRLALAQYRLIIKDFNENKNQKNLVMSLSELLRRAAISTYPSIDCASLTGKEWLNWLDRSSTKTAGQFSNDCGYLLTEFIYSNATHSDDINNLINLTEQWLKQLPTTGKSL